jgi:hypothetical protein
VPINDDRDVNEIRAGGDEMSVASRYTEHYVDTSQPGLTNEQRGVDLGSDTSWDDYEDSPQQYIDAGLLEEDWDKDDDFAVEPTFDDQLQDWAQRWTESQNRANDPNAAALSIVDSRIEEKIAGLQQAQESMGQYRAERQQTLEIREAQAELNVAEEGGHLAAQIADLTAQRHGLPRSNPEAVLAESDELFNEAALQFLNNGGRPDQWGEVSQQVAQQCVEAAAIRLGRQQISDNALKRI